MFGGSLTGFSSQALIKAMYGFSPGLRTMPERSSSLFCASGNGSCPVILEAEVAIDSSFSNSRLLYPESMLRRLSGDVVVKAIKSRVSSGHLSYLYLAACCSSDSEIHVEIM